MIFIADRNGQLGNRLWTFSHFIGWGVENAIPIANPGFHDYARYFEGTFKDPWCRYPAKEASRADAATRHATYPLIYFAARQARKFNVRTSWIATRNNKGGEVFDLRTHTSELLASKVTIIRGWQYRDDASFLKHQDAIRAHFTPRPEHLRKVAECIRRARENSQVLVGVHIRRGDYIRYLNGRYFYDHIVYGGMMKKIHDLFATKTVGFLICSNEPIETGAFRGFNYHLGPNHIIEDMYSLASCDYLIGPPSTYSIWASFYGKVPLFEMRSPSESSPLKLEDFTTRSVC